MARNFTLDLRNFEEALRRSPLAINKGASRALTDIKNDWVADSVDIAPIDTANLRRQIHGKVIDTGVNGRIEVAASAVRGGFNYAYYIHEMDAGGRSLRQGEKKFLDKPAEQNEAKWQQWLEDDIKSELRRVGW